jgi:hypothetical protein
MLRIRRTPGSNLREGIDAPPGVDGKEELSKSTRRLGRGVVWWVVADRKGRGLSDMKSGKDSSVRVELEAADCAIGASFS